LITVGSRVMAVIAVIIIATTMRASGTNNFKHIGPTVRQK
jgi:hypothetical protein